VKRQILARAYVHHQQVRKHGALKPAIRKQLLNLVRTGFEAPLKDNPAVQVVQYSTGVLTPILVGISSLVCFRGIW